MPFKKIRDKINNMSEKNFTSFIVILIICLVVAVIYNNRTQLIMKVVKAKIEIVTSVYKLSNQCILDHYADFLTEDGYVVSMEPPPEDCEATHLQDVTRYIHGYETEQELEMLSVDVYNVVVELGANATFFESCKLINAETGEVIEDFTQEMKDQHMDDFYQKPKLDA